MKFFKSKQKLVWFGPFGVQMVFKDYLTSFVTVQSDNWHTSYHFLVCDWFKIIWRTNQVWIRRTSLVVLIKHWRDIYRVSYDRVPLYTERLLLLIQLTGINLPVEEITNLNAFSSIIRSRFTESSSNITLWKMGI